eukprot:COSAG06_NODE_32966_length_497_cov_1.037688_1_plen_32_part_10
MAPSGPASFFAGYPLFIADPLLLCVCVNAERC